jgi:hypothetical protein
LEQLGSPCQGKRNANFADGNVYLHLFNIRDARNIHDNVQLAASDWRAEYISAAHFYKVYMNGHSMFGTSLVADHHQVCSSPAQADPICDGKVQITAFAQGANFNLVHIETVVQTFLETQGEVFALLRQSVYDNVFAAVVEFSDADIAISVVHRFNGVTLSVS